jgi:hypothetical protein
LYADARGNAVFVMQAGKPNRPIGAELRGTGQRVWRGLAPGSSKNAGYFWIGDPSAQHIVLCESAIDAISCHQFHAECRLHHWEGPASASRLREFVPTPLGCPRCWRAATTSTAASTPTSPARPPVTRCSPVIGRSNACVPRDHDWNDVLTAASK